MDPDKLLTYILLGGMLGVLGQGIRTIAGLKKLHDKAAASDAEFSDLFVPSVLTMSLFVGFVAGALAMFGTVEFGGTTRPGRDAMLAIIAAGYSGTDFIEGFMKKYLPRKADTRQQDTSSDAIGESS